MNLTLIKLCERHSEWVRMARSLSGKGFPLLSIEDGNDLVQEMYLKVHGIDLERIMYDDTEVNTMFIYVILRNLYYSNFNTLPY